MTNNNELLITKHLLLGNGYNRIAQFQRRAEREMRPRGPVLVPRVVKRWYATDMKRDELPTLSTEV